MIKVSRVFLLIPMFFILHQTSAQVGIGTLTPDASAELHLNSKTRGFLPPVMREAERDAINDPAEGLMVYCSNCAEEGYYVFINQQWSTINVSGLQKIGSNIHAGSQNMNDLTTGTFNIALGESAMRYITRGRENTALGNGALSNDTSGNYNIALGSDAASEIRNGSNNVAIGGDALKENHSGDGNIAIGKEAGYSTTGDGSIFIGDEAGVNEYGSNKLYLENSSSSSPLIGGNFSTDKVGINTSIGNLSSGATLQVGGSISLASGTEVNEFSTDNTLSADSDLIIPTQKAIKKYVDSTHTLLSFGTGNTHGNNNNLGKLIDAKSAYNTALGEDALSNLSNGSLNTAVGYKALDSISSGSQNVALGFEALTSTKGYSQNTAVGYRALDDITTGGGNTALGGAAGQDVLFGYNNVLIGHESGQTPDSMSYSVMMGFRAGRAAFDADYNVFIGNQSGAFTTGDSNVYIGSKAAYSLNGSNRLFIENTGSSSPLIGGNFSGDRVGINTDITNLSSGATLQVGGSLSLEKGSLIDEFSTDATFASNSDSIIPTQKAIKTYVDGNKLYKAIGTNNYHSNTNNMVSLDGAASLNTALGDYSQYSLTTGDENVSLGSYSLYSSTSGSFNTTIGNFGLFGNTSGSNNTAIGRRAGYNTTGSDNILLGKSAGGSYEGNTSIFIGNQAGSNVNLLKNVDNLFIVEHKTSSVEYAYNGEYNVLIGGDFSSRKVGINIDVTAINNSSSTFQVGGDVEVMGSANGVVLASPNGTRWRLTVDDNGVISTVALP